MDTNAVVAGSVVTIVVELLRRYGRLNTLWTYLALAAVTVAASLVYVYVKASPWGPSFIQTLTVSQTIWALLIRQLPQPQKPPGG